ncbi:antirestriction protein [Salmonella enterica]|jgi:hypothetical protein|nr:antirestriction protein [Salmonella enterica]
MQNQALPLICSRIDASRSAQVITSHIKRFDVVFQTMLFERLRLLAPDYSRTGLIVWELSNGGFYLAPDMAADCRLQAASGPLLSPDAMGIAACLVLFRHLATHTEGFDRVMFEEHYGALLAWAIERPEAAGIQQVIE